MRNRTIPPPWNGFFLFLLVPLSSAPKGGLWKRIHGNLLVREIPTPQRGRSRSDLIGLLPIVSLLASYTPHGGGSEGQKTGFTLK